MLGLELNFKGGGGVTISLTPSTAGDLAALDRCPLPVSHSREVEEAQSWVHRGPTAFPLGDTE